MGWQLKLTPAADSLELTLAANPFVLHPVTPPDLTSMISMASQSPLLPLQRGATGTNKSPAQMLGLLISVPVPDPRGTSECFPELCGVENANAAGGC